LCALFRWTEVQLPLLKQEAATKGCYQGLLPRAATGGCYRRLLPTAAAESSYLRSGTRVAGRLHRCDGGRNHNL